MRVTADTQRPGPQKRSHVTRITPDNPPAPPGLGLAVCVFQIMISDETTSYTVYCMAYYLCVNPWLTTTSLLLGGMTSPADPIFVSGPNKVRKRRVSHPF
eukprot:scaffold86308_cov69-Phaeocystis_antarctica.AAC.3